MKKTSNLRRALYAAFAAAAVLLIALSLRPKALPVETAVAGRGLFVQRIREDGRTRVKNRYVVSSPVTGRILRIALRPGDAVRSGDVLARLLPAQSPLLDARTSRELQARLGAAEAGLAMARTTIAQARLAATIAGDEAERLAKLSAAGAVSPRDLELAQSTVKLRSGELEAAEFRYHAAGHEVEMARAALGGKSTGAGPEIVIHSPVDGTVLRVGLESEALVAAGTPLLELARREELEVVVDVLSSDAVRIPVTAPVEITGWGGDGALQGRVRTIEPAAFTKLSALGVEEQRVNVVIDLLSPPEARPALGDGYRVEAAIVTAEVSDAVTVPLGALFRSGEAWAVFVVIEGRAGRREVELGLRNDRSAVVTQGVAAGDVVVVYPGDTLTDGARVSP